jgi:hypothetical protein
MRVERRKEGRSKEFNREEKMTGQRMVVTLPDAWVVTTHGEVRRSPTTKNAAKIRTFPAVGFNASRNSRTSCRCAFRAMRHHITSSHVRI